MGSLLCITINYLEKKTLCLITMKRDSISQDANMIIFVISWKSNIGAIMVWWIRNITTTTHHRHSMMASTPRTDSSIISTSSFKAFMSKSAEGSTSQANKMKKTETRKMTTIAYSIRHFSRFVPAKNVIFQKWLLCIACMTRWWWRKKNNCFSLCFFNFYTKMFHGRETLSFRANMAPNRASLVFQILSVPETKYHASRWEQYEPFRNQ